MTKRIVCLLLALMLCASLLPFSALAAEGEGAVIIEEETIPDAEAEEVPAEEEPSSAEPVGTDASREISDTKAAEEPDALALDGSPEKYLDADGNAQDVPEDATPLKPSDTALTAGWYTVEGQFTIEGRMSISGDVHIILLDGADLTVEGGIGLGDGASLTVYAQSAGSSMGALTVTGVPDNSAGIGSDNDTVCGDITLNGGFITASNLVSGAGIGCGYEGGCGSITVNGGFITAAGGIGCAGIGVARLSASCGSITVNGGTVIAQSESGTGIGSAGMSSCGTVTLNGGFIKADKGTGDHHIGDAAGNAVIGAGVSYDSGESGEYRLINYRYYAPIPATCTATGLTEYFKNELDGTYHTALPFTTANRIAEGDIATQCLVPMTPHPFAVLDGDSHKCTVCGAVKDHSFDESGSCSCGIAKHGDESRSFLFHSKNGNRLTLYLPESVILTEITAPGEYEGGWYILSGESDMNGQILFKDDAHLILADGAYARCRGVALKDDVSLSLYAQSSGESSMGKLTVSNVPAQTAGIGGNGSDCGNITLHGGNLDVTGGVFGAGIGSGSQSQCGNITIHDGIITSNGGILGAGIGSGYNGSSGSITVNGGTVTTTGGTNAASLGEGFLGTCGDITLGSSMAAYELDGDEIVRRLSDVSEFSETQSVLICEKPYEGDTAPTYLDYIDGEFVPTDVPEDATPLKPSDTALTAGWYTVEGQFTIEGRMSISGDVHIILLNGADLTVEGGIGLEPYAFLTIYAQSEDEAEMGSLTATEVTSGAGIGTGNNSNARGITINGGKITATGSTECAGIGAGKYSCGDITINGGIVSATGGSHGAGIGGANRGACTGVTINGGTVNATGGSHGAGIGGGSTGFLSIISINGGSIIAEGGGGAAGIGAGYGGDCNTVKISGGRVEATGGEGCGSIGNGGGFNLDDEKIIGACGWIIFNDVAAYELDGDEIVREVKYTDELNEVSHALICRPLPDFDPSQGDAPAPDDPSGGESGGDSESGRGKQAPKTGDPSCTALWLALICTSALAAAALIKKQKA